MNWVYLINIINFTKLLNIKLLSKTLAQTYGDCNLVTAIVLDLNVKISKLQINFFLYLIYIFYLDY